MEQGIDLIWLVLIIALAFGARAAYRAHRYHNITTHRARRNAPAQVLSFILPRYE